MLTVGDVMYCILVSCNRFLPNLDFKIFAKKSIVYGEAFVCPIKMKFLGRTNNPFIDHLNLSKEA